jgi:hypothetical protein
VTGRPEGTGAGQDFDCHQSNFDQDTDTMLCVTDRLITTSPITAINLANGQVT